MSNLNTLPENYQNVYVLFSGMGTEKYFTASSDEEATKFLIDENVKTQYTSAFKTGVIIMSTGNHFFRNGIPIYCNEDNNLLK